MRARESNPGIDSIYVSRDKQTTDSAIQEKLTRFGIDTLGVPEEVLVGVGFYGDQLEAVLLVEDVELGTGEVDRVIAGIQS